MTGHDDPGMGGMKNRYGRYVDAGMCQKQASENDMQRPVWTFGGINADEASNPDPSNSFDGPEGDDCEQLDDDLTTLPWLQDLSTFARFAPFGTILSYTSGSACQIFPARSLKEKQPCDYRPSNLP